MLTVKQAKEMGVVFVEGDKLSDVTIAELRVYQANNTNYFDHLKVTSFTDRKHTGNETPCCGDLPVVVTLRGELRNKGLADEYVWDSNSYCPILSWKPDLESLEKLANKKEEKPMAEKQYTYELVTDLTTNEIAKAMIDGEVFYSEHGKFEYKWDGNRFIEKEGTNIAVTGNFYRRKEIEMITRTITYPKPVSEPLNDGDEYWVVFADSVAKCTWVGSNSMDFKWLNQCRIHLTKENARANLGALFGSEEKDLDL